MLKRCHTFVLFVIVLIVNACTAAAQIPTDSDTNDGLPAATVEVVTPTPQPTRIPGSLGPELEGFPEGYNPLTGLPVSNPARLERPALLISISHFPATARPQAGLSFAPYVFEFSITRGETRFLAAFFGEFPETEIPVRGDCAIRSGAFEQKGLVLGNRVWWDKNADGLQDFDEPGVGGICVNLYDAAGNLLLQATTDSNGYYGFNVEPGHYIVQALKPAWMEFTLQNAGEDEADSDADLTTGQMDAEVQDSHLTLDAGLIPSSTVTPTPDPFAILPRAQVGPVRSGRLIYGHINAFFQDACLIYAFASAEVLEQIPQCFFVTHDEQGGGYMLSLEQMLAIAKDNARHTSGEFNYASNLYLDGPPEGGVVASQVEIYFSYLNQSMWKYDPLYEAWLRYVDTTIEEEAGVLHPEVERLTGRQLHFENFIVLFAEHEVISPTNLNIHLEQGMLGPALLFRDGRMYEINWSTMIGEYEQSTGLRRPIQFLHPDGTPAALKPGHTWVLIVTPFSPVTETSPGIWNVQYLAPEGSE